MTKTKRILILIISALMFFASGIALTFNVKDASAAAFSFEPGASIKASDYVVQLRFELTGVSMNAQVGIAYCTTDKVKIGTDTHNMKTGKDATVSVGIGTSYIYVQLSSPLDEVRLYATQDFGITRVYSDTRSQLQILRSAYDAGDTAWMTQSMLDIIHADDTEFHLQVKTQDFLKIYQFDETLAENNATVFKNVVSDCFNEDLTYKVEELGTAWDELSGSTLSFTWKSDEVNYSLSFKVDGARNVEVTSSENFTFEYWYTYAENYHFVKFDLFSDFDESQITDFNMTATDGLAVYASVPVNVEDYYAELESEVTILRSEKADLLLRVDDLETLTDSQKTELDTANARITELENDIAVKVARITELEERKAELEKQLAQAEDTHEVDTANIKKLSAELETVKTSLATDKKELVETITALNVELNEYKSKVQAYEKAEEESGDDNGVSVGCSANASTSLPFICIVALVVSCIILGGKIYVQKKK